MKNTHRYLELTKPKVTLLNLFVGVTSFILAEFPSINWSSLIAFSLVGYLAVGGCGVLNCYFDRDIDKQMFRTSKRVLPAAGVEPKKALSYGVALISVSFIVTYVVFGPMTLLWFSIGAFFYLLIYTLWLKRATRWNVVIGGAAGSFAALAGWTATGNALSSVPLLIGLLDFLWTPSHLWGLAIKMTDDYRTAGIPMLPVASGLRKASEFVLYFNIAALATCLLFPIFGSSGLIFMVVSTVAGCFLIMESCRLLNQPSEQQGFRVFKVSMPFLASVMIGLIVDKLVPLNLQALL